MNRWYNNFWHQQDMIISLLNGHRSCDQPGDIIYGHPESRSFIDVTFNIRMYLKPARGVHNTPCIFPISQKRYKFKGLMKINQLVFWIKLFLTVHKYLPRGSCLVKLQDYLSIHFKLDPTIFPKNIMRTFEGNYSLDNRIRNKHLYEMHFSVFTIISSSASSEFVSVEKYTQKNLLSILNYDTLKDKAF